MRRVPGPIGLPVAAKTKALGQRPVKARMTRKPEGKPAAATGPLGRAKAAWQPAMRWCQKEMRELYYMDAQVKTAVQEFTALVTAVLAASSGAALSAAQEAAAAYVNKHPFLRWAPIPSPLPTVETE